MTLHVRLKYIAYVYALKGITTDPMNNVINRPMVCPQIAKK